MTRREFIAAAGAASIWPFAARAQSTAPEARVGVLMNQETPVTRALLEAFEQALGQLGWNRDRNLRIDVRWANAQNSAAAAEELLALKPDAVLAFTTLALSALRERTRTIPIVFVEVSDPVAQGFVASFSHPGGNITGFAQFDFSMGGKWLELLRSVAPSLAHVSVLFNPDSSPQGPTYAQSVRTAATSAIEVVGEPVRALGDIDGAIERLSQRSNPGLIVPTDSFLARNAQTVVNAAAQFRVPAVYGLSAFVDVGGLMYYGIPDEDRFRQAAGYIDRILRGAKPADLPVQNPTQFQLAINIKTAKALGITVPQSLLVQADQVIE